MSSAARDEQDMREKGLMPYNKWDGDNLVDDYDEEVRLRSDPRGR